MAVIRWLLAFLLAVLVTALLGSVIQTQFNLARIAELGQQIDWGTRLEVTLFDLLSFAPTYAIVSAFALLIALLVAAWPASRLPGLGRGWFALAGFVAIYTALAAMNAMLPVTLIGASRGLLGTLLLSAAGAVGGFLYASVLVQRQKGQN
ncbi:hypothetical protein [Wenzhouxiangella marina]|nr:hypothetical protein [Wenzhouxiangella marina]MBB6086128.1 hypothetical protein [Wenzhouxiangella marina]